MGEKVLVFPADLVKDIPQPLCQNNHILDQFEELCCTQATFKDRVDVENDPTWKQLIPYVVIWNSDTDSYLLYKRTGSGGEGRLHNKYSIGIGGHINIEDAGFSLSDKSAPFISALYRELDEELDWGPEGIVEDHMELVAFINDNSNDVGKVHFGAVMQMTVLDADPGYPRPKNKEIASIEWISSEELKKIAACQTALLMADPESIELENWSKIIAGEMGHGR